MCCKGKKDPAVSSYYFRFFFFHTSILVHYQRHCSRKITEKMQGLFPNLGFFFMGIHRKDFMKIKLFLNN